jgi:phosphate starvation-inducible PhoH-like protein
MEIQEKKYKVEAEDLRDLLGSNDQNLQLIENKFQSTLIIRGENIIIRGNPNEVKIIEKVFNELIYILHRSGTLNVNDVSTVLGLVDSNNNTNGNQKSYDTSNIIYSGIKETIKIRSQKQREYFDKVQNNDLVFAIGPAGTGKTFLAVAMALASLKKNEVSNIILSRPAVEAGESLGFLPGDLTEKLDPYLKPLTDALFYMLSSDKLKNYMEKGVIEIIPLAYMRGRTLNNSFIILDEAQNATITQMKMFLTRLGANSKAVITGDITQIDLDRKENSGLINANKVLQNIEGIEFVYFSEKDVVRHKLVADIIKAYENEYYEKENSNLNGNDNT